LPAVTAVHGASASPDGLGVADWVEECSEQGRLAGDEWHLVHQVLDGLQCFQAERLRAVVVPDPVAVGVLLGRIRVLRAHVAGVAEAVGIGVLLERIVSG
jgi:hypothetical protein